MKCCDVKIGHMNEPLLFEDKVQRGVSDGMGGYVDTWSPVTDAPTFGQVREASGQEIWKMQQLEARANVVIMTRYSGGISEGMRVTIRGREHAVVRVENIEMADRFYRIYAVRGQKS